MFRATPTAKQNLVETSNGATNKMGADLEAILSKHMRQRKEVLKMVQPRDMLTKPPRPKNRLVSAKPKLYPAGKPPVQRPKPVVDMTLQGLNL